MNKILLKPVMFNVIPPPLPECYIKKIKIRNMINCIIYKILLLLFAMIFFVFVMMFFGVIISAFTDKAQANEGATTKDDMKNLNVDTIIVKSDNNQKMTEYQKSISAWRQNERIKIAKRFDELRDTLLQKFQSQRKEILNNVSKIEKERAIQKTKMGNEEKNVYVEQYSQLEREYHKKIKILEQKRNSLYEAVEKEYQRCIVNCKN